MTEQRPINILFTTSTLPRWQNDSELSVVLDIAKNLTSRYKELNISILAPHYPGAKENEILEGIQIYRFKYFFTNWQKLCYDGGILANIKKNKFLIFLIPAFIFSQIISIRKIVAKKQIELIHAHWLIPQGFCLVIYKLLLNRKVKTVCTVHGSDFNALHNTFFKKLQKFTINRLDQVTSVSQIMAQKIKIDLVSDKQINHIPNSVSMTNFISTDLTNFTKQQHIAFPCLLYIGRLVQKKGVKYLIQAVATILKTYPSLKLLIVGDGPEKIKLQNLAKNLNLDDAIIFTGKIPHEHLSSYYNLADIVVIPSLSEGLSLVIMEALSFAKPVIATCVGGNQELIINDQTGILINPKDTIEIVESVDKLLKNDALRKNLGTNGQKLINQDYSFEKVSEQYYQIYQTIFTN